jgi:hypothetical protein
VRPKTSQDGSINLAIEKISGHMEGWGSFTKYLAFVTLGVLISIYFTKTDVQAGCVLALGMFAIGAGLWARLKRLD